ncbi:MAG: LysR family transcriptional regulator [Pseudobdellovibrionaceae bacterium]
MNLLHLEYFYTVAKEGGFLRASERLRIQQPAISRMVAQLEDYFGFKLFEKIGRNVRLTSQGQEVFESCQRIFGEVEKLKSSVGKILGEPKGPLVIAAAEPIASRWLPDKVASLVKNYPEIYPNIFSGPASLMLKKIENGEIEIGFFFHIPDLSDKLIIEKNISIPFRFVVRKDLRKKEEVLTSFIGSREIDDIGTRRYPTLERLRREFPEAKIRFSSNNLTAHKELVLKGAGVAILPEFLLEEDLQAKTVVDVFSHEKFQFNLKIVKRKTTVLSLACTKLLAEDK